jgi:NAD(P)-dependent dehydrogenase (short-subunit alcohol dehydrogenase family)
MGNTKSVAIITGASQGMGRATALRLARDFSAIALVARDKDNLETTATEVMSLGAEATASALDLRQPQSAKSIIEGTLERFGRIDALLNIAGAVPQIDLFQMTGRAVGRRHGAQAERRASVDHRGLGRFEGLEWIGRVHVRKRRLCPQTRICGSRGDQCSH